MDRSVLLSPFIIQIMEKKILDPCCGSKMFWFDKQHPAVLFGDIREESFKLCDGRTLEIKPDMEIDFRAMPFEDSTFKMVVFDPPHLKDLGQNTWMAQKYGVLLPTWETDIQCGFDECMRVLEPNGVLIFKWNEIQIKLTKVLEIIKHKPLFGHTSGKHGRTVWLAFMKGL
jgi:SAM-dependent methyltransferase